MTEKLNIAGVTLEGVAQGGWQTAIHIAEARAIFDAGTMLSANTDHIFITHGHPDHIGALPSITARRATHKQPASAKPLSIHVPAPIAETLRVALSSMESIFGDRSTGSWAIVPHVPDDVVSTGGGITVRALRTFHGVASCGWAVEQTVRKLKAEFNGLSGPDIVALRAKGVEITDTHVNTMVTIPGDTMIDFLIREEQAQKAKVLLHEVTFWDDKSTVEKCRHFGHTHVDEMIEHCDKFEGEALVLVHRSLKHSRAEVEEIMRKRFPAAMLPKLHLFDGGDR